MNDRLQSNIDRLCSALRSVAGSADAAQVLLHAPEFAGNEWTYVKECIDTGWVSSAGKYVDEFERQLARFTGAGYAIAVSNGTAALHVALKLAGVETGDEVIIPALTFVGTANSVAHCGAIPHFVDSEESTLGLDPDALEAHLNRIGERTATGLRNRETGRRIAAIVPMHTFGHPVRIDRLMDVAGRFGLPVVEDAAESLGSTFDGQHTGTFGVMGILSFNGNKIITTGGGGAILTNDAKLAAHAKHLTTTAKTPHKWEFHHDEIAWNYRLPNLNAALGVAQLEQLPGMLVRKRDLAHRYQRAFEGAAGFHFVAEPARSRSNYWLNCVRIDANDLSSRDAFLQAANDAGYQCRPVWKRLDRLPMYESCPRADLSVAQAIERSLINLPSSAFLEQAKPLAAGAAGKLQAVAAAG